MPPGIAPPLQVVASGVCPQGLSPADIAPDTVGCTVVRGPTGTWEVTAHNPAVDPLKGHALIAFPGNGSNLAGGISFGQATASRNSAGLTVFLFESYRNVGAGEDPPGEPVDVEVQFIIVRWPTGAGAS